jgi:hypothetical protein
VVVASDEGCRRGGRGRPRVSAFPNPKSALSLKWEAIAAVQGERAMKMLAFCVCVLVLLKEFSCETSEFKSQYINGRFGDCLMMSKLSDVKLVSCINNKKTLFSVSIFIEDITRPHLMLI